MCSNRTQKGTIMNNLDLTPLFQAVIMLVAVLITTFVVPYIKKKTNAADLGEFQGWVEIAVAAAEQIYKVTDGEKKKQYVLEYLQNKGYSVDVDDLENAIEAAVLKLHNALYGVEANESK